MRFVGTLHLLAELAPIATAYQIAIGFLVEAMRLATDAERVWRSLPLQDMFYSPCSTLFGVNGSRVADGDGHG